MSEWIAFLDDDDEWYPEKLEVQYSFTMQDTALVCSDYMIESPDGSLQRFSDNRSDLDVRRWIPGENLVGCTSFPLLNRKAFIEAGMFDPIFEANQDWDLWIRMLDLGRVSESSGCAGIKHCSDMNISSNGSRRRNGWKELFDKHRARYRGDLPVYSRALWYAYTEMRLYGYRLSAARYLVTYGVVSRTAMLLKKG